jgi:hypothetical protein
VVLPVIKSNLACPLNPEFTNPILELKLEFTHLTCFP